MEVAAQTGSNSNKYLKLLLKIAVTGVCLWWVSRKINFKEAGHVLQNANWFFILLAIFSFMFSKFLASSRLNLYFKNINIRLPQVQNLKLYWLGMFYNLFLPGSISGDAYKIIVLTKKYSVPYKKTTAAILLDRFSGLLALGLILAGYSLFVLNDPTYKTVLVAASAMSVIVLYVTVKYFFSDFITSFWTTFFWGVGVQIFQVVCAYCVISALHIPFHQTEYIFIFLVSSVVAVLPFTIGGLGARELVFYWGSQYFGLDKETAVIISLLFYLTTVVSSLWGIPFIFSDPLKENNNIHPHIYSPSK